MAKKPARRYVLSYSYDPDVFVGNPVLVHECLTALTKKEAIRRKGRDPFATIYRRVPVTPKRKAVKRGK